MAVACPYCGQPTQYLTARQVGQLLDLNEATVRQKIYAGHFPGAELVPGIHKKGMWRIPTSAVLPLTEGLDGLA